MRNKILDFCVENGLLDKGKAEFLSIQYERTTWDIGTIIDHVSEIGLYREASKKFNCPIFTNFPLINLKDFTKILSKERQKLFNCMIIDENDGVLKVITWNFFNTEIIPHAFQELTGKKVDLYLATYTNFKYY